MREGEEKMMNLYRLNALIAEFPFLEDVLTNRLGSGIYFGGDSITRQEAFQKASEDHGDKFRFWVKAEDNYVYSFCLDIPDSVSIKRADDNLLNQVPNSDSYSWSGGGHCDYNHYYAMMKCDALYEAKILDTNEVWSDASGDNGSTDAGTIAEQLYTKSLNPDFIVSVEFHDTDDNGNGETSFEVVIYKMDKFDLKAYHEAQIKKVIAKLQTEVEAVA